MEVSQLCDMAIDDEATRLVRAVIGVVVLDAEVLGYIDIDEKIIYDD